MQAGRAAGEQMEEPGSRLRPADRKPQTARRWHGAEQNR